MNAIVTVIGKDKVGIIATVCIKLAELNVNVLDISQTILNNLQWSWQWTPVQRTSALISCLRH